MSARFFSGGLLCCLSLLGCSPPAQEASSGAGIVPLQPPSPPASAAPLPVAAPPAAEVPPSAASTPTASEVPGPASSNAAPAAYSAFAPPVARYYETEDRIAVLLEQVDSGLPPGEAAPQLRSLAEEMRPRIRPYWLWLAGATNDQKTAMVQKRVEMIVDGRGKASQEQGSRVIEIARQPGNEAFKAALAAMFQAHVDNAPRVHAANAQKMLDELSR